SPVPTPRLASTGPAFCGTPPAPIPLLLELGLDGVSAHATPARGTDGCRCGGGSNQFREHGSSLLMPVCTTAHVGYRHGLPMRCIQWMSTALCEGRRPTT